MNSVLISILTVTFMLGMIGIVAACKGGIELYRVIRYRDFGFNEDTFICLIVFLFGILAIFMSLSMWV